MVSHKWQNNHVNLSQHCFFFLGGVGLTFPKNVPARSVAFLFHEIWALGVVHGCGSEMICEGEWNIGDMPDLYVARNR